MKRRHSASATGDRTCLRIALVYDDSLDRHGGIPQYLTVLGRALVRLGHEVDLLVGSTTANATEGCRVHSLARNVQVRFNGNRLSMPILADRAAIRSVVGTRDYDVVHVQVPYSPVLAGHLIRQLADRVALVGTFHVASERMAPTAGARLLAAVTPDTRTRFDAMMCVSTHAAHFARRTFGVRHPPIVPNMIDVASFAATPVRPPSVPTIVSLGALVPRKGPLQLVEAFARVRRAVPAARLRIGGDGPLRRALERRVRRFGMGDAVELLGPVRESDKAEFLRDAHVACFPARYGESFGIVLLEAIASGGPAVLAGDNAGYRCVLGTVPGSLCTPEPGPLARALENLLVDAERRRALGRAQARVLDAYDADQVACQVLDVYARALARRRSGAKSDELAAA
jgi:phosphatidylinositol alpha-mannosyltransferase